jgi:hypothetical protein
MSYPPADMTPAGKQRPATVTVASALLYLVAALQVASIAVSFLSLGVTRQVINDQFAGTPNADAVGTATTVAIIVAICVGVVFAVGTTVLGVLVGRGKNPARIVTWVLGGLGVLCYGCGLAGTAVSSSLTSSLSGTADPQTEELQRRLRDAIPAWQTAVSTVSQVLFLLLLLAIIILLALPASNDFFRRDQEVWVPPTWTPGPGGGYPPPPSPGTGYPPPPSPGTGYPPPPSPGTGYPPPPSP